VGRLNADVLHEVYDRQNIINTGID